jgi:membrane-bound serine protease (ClpP class)
MTRGRRVTGSIGLLLAGIVGALAAMVLSLWLTPPALALTPPDLATGGKSYIVEVSGEIDLGLSSYVERVLAEAAPGDLVVLHVNTFGGRIDAAVAIRDALLTSKVRTVAFIDKRAISAGALISLATDTIVMTHGATIGAATPVQLEGGKMAPVEAKVVSYFRKEMKATAEAKGRRGDLAEAMVDASVVIEGLDGKDTTLTLTTDEALKYEVAAFSVEDLDALGQRLGRDLAPSSPTMMKRSVNWAERIARVLSDPSISSLLMTLGMLGIMLELWAPGHAVAGGLGVLCLVLFFFGHYVVHLAGWGEIILFVAGVAAVVLEVFFFPGHGLVAALGVLAIVASLVLAMISTQHVPLSVNWHGGGLIIFTSLRAVFGSILATFAIMALLSRWLPRSRLGRMLTNEQQITARVGSGAAQLAGDAAGASGAVGEAVSFVGKRGVARTTLRPSGKVEIDGRRYDVVTDGALVDEGTEVIVIETDGTRIVVRGVTEA